MARVPRTSLLLFAIGFIVNVCVAWTFAVRPLLPTEGGFGGSGRPAPPRIGDRIAITPDVFRATRGRSVHRTTGDVLIRQVPARRSLPIPLCDEPKFQSLIPGWSAFAHDSVHQALDDSDTHYFAEHAAGWPLLSFRRNRIRSHHGLSDPEVIIDHGAISLPQWVARQGLRTLLPVTPIWPGVIINSIFYAGLVHCLFLGPAIVRRRLRTRSDRCPQCAYPRGTSPRCTECGSTLRDRPSDVRWDGGYGGLKT